MKNDHLLKDFHIGKMIKEIARRKEISSGKLSATIHRYQQNAEKIFKLKDMHVDDVIRISYTLEYNLLEALSDIYLSRFQFTEYKRRSESYIEFDTQTRTFTIKENSGNSNFLEDIHIGEHIKKIAIKKGWKAHDLAKRLNCAQSSISYLYTCKTLKIRTLINISIALRSHLIAEVYLVRMNITPAFLDLDGFIILNEQPVRIVKTSDTTFSIVFCMEEMMKNSNDYSRKIGLES